MMFNVFILHPNKLVFSMSIINWRPATLGSYEYPLLANALGWVLAMSSLLPIPIVAIIVLLKADGEGMREVSVEFKYNYTVTLQVTDWLQHQSIIY